MTETSKQASVADDTTSVLELTSDNFAKSIDDHPLAVVDFWAPWCAPCRAFAPVFAAAAARHPDALFAKVNTEDQQEIAAQFGIRSIPTLMIFRDNIIVFSEAGALGAGALEQVLAAAKALDMEAVRRNIEAEDAASESEGASPGA
jgi:thioredoxin 1